MHKKSAGVLRVSPATQQQLAAAAQFFKIGNADHLAEIVLTAFLEMRAEDPEILFPLMLQQVRPE